MYSLGSIHLKKYINITLNNTMTSCRDIIA